ncbi:MAG: DUF624 domain-containing protein [Solobacterium sp.]|nr:DUF624 domain-containing protein [Solobacterium sp.]MDD6496791.1 DUF624 domain-containing protein [Solobacterium sp.]
MKSFFNPDNELWRGVSYAFDVFVLCICFVLTSSLVFTLGLGLCALYYSVDKYLVERKALPIEGFAKSIKQNYKIAIVADVILSLIVLFVLWSMWISYQMMSGGVLMGRLVFTFGIVILVFLVGYISFVFPTLASYKYGLKELLGISFKLTVVHLPIAILFSVLYLLVILCAYYFWPSLFFTPVLVVLVQRRFLNSIYSKHTK